MGAIGNVLLPLFLVLRVAQQALEHWLAALNHRYAMDPRRQQEAAALLEIPPDDMAAAARYSTDRYRFGLVSSWTHVGVELVFLAAGGLGLVDAWARGVAGGRGEVGVGLVFFAILGLAAGLLNLPLALYHTFVIEARHGFNRQTLRGFLLDRLKGALLAAALGGPLLAALLFIIEEGGPSWWVYGWAAVSAFSLLTAWIYPTLLAPLFNRFTPLPEGELKERILELARRIGFRTSGLYVMDASRRTSHGNAYFTGLLGAKRIVLFDTLLESMGVSQVVAVLAHELGHFKLHHVRRQLIRGVLVTGVWFRALSLVLHLEAFYQAFGIPRSAHGGLVVFGLWFGLAEFLLQPVFNHISRKYEFEADAFALAKGGAPRDLAGALLRLRERSRILPLSHPLYSRIYHSHPPLLERLEAMGAL
jgi:STE24 endopeptidase